MQVGCLAFTWHAGHKRRRLR